MSLQRNFICVKIDMRGYENMSQKKKVATKSSVNTKNEKNISIKNYIYAFLILVGAIVLTLYIFEWYQVKREEKLMTSYLISSKTIESSIEDLNSLNQIRQEAPSSYFIYLSYTSDEKVYDLEKELKRVIDKYKLNDMFYYVDLTELKENNENYLVNIKDSLHIKELKRVPALVYVYEGQILERNVLDGTNNKLFTVDEVEKLLKDYDFETVK